MTAIRILIARTAGSVPREAGTVMTVTATEQDGTIGGGTLEFQAVAEARAMLVAGVALRQQTLPLGPALGQCCGGSVTLIWERVAGDVALPRAIPLESPCPMPATVAQKLGQVRPGAAPLTLDGWLIEAGSLPRRPVWIWGAGHVGRALVGVLAPLPDLSITWIDTSADRFPAQVPQGVTTLPATDPALLARHAPQDADHLILTYSHDIDLSLCHALLARGFASCGLIGSATKWARFRGRLASLGHTHEQIARIACPIGDAALGKHPQAIALGVATSLLRQTGTNINRGTDDGARNTA